MFKEHSPEEFYGRIGRNLHTVRNARKRTIAEAAVTLDLSHSTLSKIENGRYPGLGIDLLIRLCNYYQVNLSNIMHVELSELLNPAATDLYPAGRFIGRHPDPGKGAQVADHVAGDSDDPMANGECSNELLIAYCVREIAGIRAQLNRMRQERDGGL